MVYQLIIFDYDGVLISTFDLAYELISKYKPHVSEEEFRSWFRGNVYDSLIEEEQDWDMMKRFFEEYNPKMLQKNIVPGIATVIQSLAKDAILAIVSSTSTSGIREQLERHNLAQYFSDILGYDVEASKTVKIRNLLTQYNLQPSQAVYITDTLGDIREAEAAGVHSIGVTWGYHRKETLDEGDPLSVIESPDLLLKLAK